jgi:hypothetical protein
MRGGTVGPPTTSGGYVCSQFTVAGVCARLQSMVPEDEEPSLGTYLDYMYDLTLAVYGTPLSTGIFDRTMLLPLSQLPAMVKAESDEELPLDRLGSLVSDGWIPDLKVADTGEPGFAMYVPSRVGLFLFIERGGYDATELRSLAEYEEGFIDAILVNEEAPYLDDDRELLLCSWRTRIEQADSQLRLRREHGDLSTDEEAKLLDEIEQVERSVSFLDRRQLEGMSKELREKTARMAYRVRARDELVRVWMLNHERAVMRAGYTPYLIFDGVQDYGGDESEPPVTGPPNWNHSLREPWASDEGVSIRLPGLRIVGDRMTFSPPLKPSDYAVRWREFDLDGYLRVRAQVLGERKCPYCHRKLPADAPADRRYCSGECRTNAKMQRYRARLKTVPTSRHQP